MRRRAGDLTAESLAAANGDDDLDLIARRHQGFPMPAAGHDLAVALDCDAFSRQTAALKQLGDAERRIQPLPFAVDGQFDQGCDNEIANSNFITLLAPV